MWFYFLSHLLCYHLKLKDDNKVKTQIKNKMKSFFSVDKTTVGWLEYGRKYNGALQGLLYTGCNDGKIRVYEPDRDEPLEVLEGHDACVTSLHLSSKTKTLISASWDCTAKVWINNKVKL